MQRSKLFSVLFILIVLISFVFANSIQFASESIGFDTAGASIQVSAPPTSYYLGQACKTSLEQGVEVDELIVLRPNQVSANDIRSWGDVDFNAFFIGTQSNLGRLNVLPESITNVATSCSLSLNIKAIGKKSGAELDKNLFDRLSVNSYLPEERFIYFPGTAQKMCGDGNCCAVIVYTDTNCVSYSTGSSGGAAKPDFSMGYLFYALIGIVFVIGIVFGIIAYVFRKDVKKLLILNLVLLIPSGLVFVLLLISFIISLLGDGLRFGATNFFSAVMFLIIFIFPILVFAKPFILKEIIESNILFWRKISITIAIIYNLIIFLIIFVAFFTVFVMI